MNLMPLVVFVRPQAAGNIGALARVMSNFQAMDLRLVGDNPALRGDSQDPFRTMDWALAKKGEPILRAAQWFSSLEEAIQDCHLVFGSSGRELEFDRGYARPLIGPQQAWDEILTHQNQAQSLNQSFRWALVLGPEDDGLNAHEASLCQKLIRIPTVDQSPSLNIAMAAGLMLYHFHLAQSGAVVSGRAPQSDTGAFLPEARASRLPSTEPGRWEAATEGQKEQFLDYVMSTIAQTSFLKYPDDDSVKSRIRRWLQHARIPLGELLFAFEIIYHFRAWGSGKFENRDFLKKR